LTITVLSTSPSYSFLPRPALVSVYAPLLAIPKGDLKRSSSPKRNSDARSKARNPKVAPQRSAWLQKLSLLSLLLNITHAIIRVHGLELENKISRGGAETRGNTNSRSKKISVFIPFRFCVSA
jgi:hypothetical protein